MPWAGAALGPHWHTALRSGDYRGSKEEKQDPERASLCLKHSVLMSFPLLTLSSCHFAFSSNIFPAPLNMLPGELTLSHSFGKLSNMSREQRKGLSVRGQAKLSSCAFLLGIPFPLPSRKRLRDLFGNLLCCSLLRSRNALYY